VSPSGRLYVTDTAARRVFASGLDVTMVGLDVTHQALLTFAEAEALRGTGRAGRLVAELVDFYARSHRDWEGTPIHDAVAVAHVVDPGLLTLTACNVEVDCGPVCRGRTICDLHGTMGRPANARVATGIRPGFGAWLSERIARLG